MVLVSGRDRSGRDSVQEYEPALDIERVQTMNQTEMICKLVNLENQAKVYASEYLRLIQVNGKLTRSPIHNNEEIRLKSKIQNIMRRIVFLRGRLNRFYLHRASTCFDIDTLGDKAQHQKSAKKQTTCYHI